MAPARPLHVGSECLSPFSDEQAIELARRTARCADVDIQAREILRMREELNNILVRHTGQSLKRIEKDTDRDFFMTGKQAQEYGLVDEVIAARPDGNLKK